MDTVLLEVGTTVLSAALMELLDCLEEYRLGEKERLENRSLYFKVI